MIYDLIYDMIYDMHTCMDSMSKPTKGRVEREVKELEVKKEENDIINNITE